MNISLQSPTKTENIYDTVQFEIDIYMRVTQEISRATHEFHASKALKYTFTHMSL